MRGVFSIRFKYSLKYSIAVDERSIIQSVRSLANILDISEYAEIKLDISSIDLVNRVTRECIKAGLSIIDGYNDNSQIYIIVTRKQRNSKS